MSSNEENIVQELQSSDLLDVVRSFRDVLQSCMGPKGGIKILVSSGGISIVTSSSFRLLSNYIFSHPVCVFISQIMKSQISLFGDSGLYTGLLTANLLERALKQQIVVQSKASELICHLSSQVRSVLEFSTAKLKLDFSTVKQLIPIVRTIISSKPGCGLNKKDIDYVSIQIVKVFLNTLNDNMGHVIIINGNDVEGTRIIDGILYTIDIEEEFLQNFVNEVAKQYTGNLTLLLFDIMLTDTELHNEVDITVKENCGLILKQATCILEYAIKKNVKIVACQKVVHDSLKLMLQRNGILLLDRLGTDFCKAIEKLSGAKPVSSLGKVTLESLVTFFGTVDSVNDVRWGQRNYVVLKKSNCNVATLVLKCASEEAFAEQKIVAQQALTALQQVTCQPFVVPGAGCLEMWLTTQLREQGLSENSDKLQKAAIGWLQRSLLSIVDTLETSALLLAVDTVYCHSWSSWNPDEGGCCRCGLVQTSDVKAAKGIWIQPNFLAVDSLVFPERSKFSLQPLVPKIIYENAIVDVYISKYNAIKLALETCVNILNIGLVVYKVPV